MTINHIDQLAEWWESGEEGIPSAGDTVIFDERHRGLGFHVTQATKDHPHGYDNARILARAPKSKPAWRDAVAVIASTDYCERQVWERDTTYENRWDGTAGDGAVTRDLRDVTPLIEAKVTDEARDRVWHELVHHGLIDPDKHRPSQGWTADVVHVALGLETE